MRVIVEVVLGSRPLLSRQVGPRSVRDWALFAKLTAAANQTRESLRHHTRLLMISIIERGLTKFVLELQIKADLGFC